MSSRFGRTVRHATQVRFGTRRGATAPAARGYDATSPAGRRPRPSSWPAWAWSRRGRGGRRVCTRRPVASPARRPRRAAFFVARFGLARRGRRRLGARRRRLGLGGSCASASWRASASRPWSPASARRPRRRRGVGSAAGGGLGRALGLDAAPASGWLGRRLRPAGVGGGLRLGDRDVAPDVDPPAGQSGREPGVLALAADRQREHPLGHRHARDPVLLVDVDRDDLGRAQGVGHEHAGVVAPRDDVDLLAGQLGHDGLDARAALADGGTDRIEAVLARRDGHLGAAAGLAGDRLDLDRAAVDLRDLELEQALEEALVRPADEDLRSLGRASDLEHERLDVLADAVVLERRSARSWRGSPRRSCRRRG